MDKLSVTAPVVYLNANGVPRRSNWTATLNESLRASGGALLVLACRPHHIRVIARMLERHSAASVVFTDAVPKGKVSALLFDPLPGCSVSAMLASVLGDESLCRSLVSAPSTVDHACGSSASPASEAFVAAAQRAHADGESLKLSAPSCIRRALLDAVLALPAGDCLVTREATRCFTVTAVASASAFLYRAASEPEEILRSAFAQRTTGGHWFKGFESAEQTRAGVICKAHFKMRELMAEDAEWGDEFATPPLAGEEPRGCIDIGAAPGGWTELLSRSGNVKVIAVDPGDLDATVTSRPNVTHMRLLLRGADDSVAQIRAELPAGGATWCVCDMNVRPRDTALLMVALAEGGCLAPGCLLAMTVKVTVRGKLGRAKQEEDAVAAISNGFFEDVRLRWLFANTQHETTLTARYRPPAAITTTTKK